MGPELTSPESLRRFFGFCSGGLIPRLFDEYEATLSFPAFQFTRRRPASEFITDLTCTPVAAQNGRSV